MWVSSSFWRGIFSMSPKMVSLSLPFLGLILILDQILTINMDFINYDIILDKYGQWQEYLKCLIKTVRCLHLFNVRPSPRSSCKFFCSTDHKTKSSTCFKHKIHSKTDQIRYPDLKAKLYTPKQFMNYQINPTPNTFK